MATGDLVRPRRDTRQIKEARATQPFPQELRRLLDQRSLSLRALASQVGVGHDHLSRLLRGDRAKRVSPELAEEVAIALQLPADYFLEVRLARVIGALEDNPGLLEDIYERVRRGASRERRSAS